MKQAREEVLKRDLTVRETENLVKRLKANRPVKVLPKPDPHVTDLEEQLKRHFKAKVAIRQNGKKGKIEIFYTSPVELDRLLDILKK